MNSKEARMTNELSPAIVEAIQADREAAAYMWEALRRFAWEDFQVDWLREGAADRGPVVQAFAHHRLASLRAEAG